MVNLSAIELGKVIGQGLADANNYKQDFIETEEVTDLNLVGVQSINTVGSYYTYQKNLGTLGLMSTSILPSLVAYLKFDEESGSTATDSITGDSVNTSDSEISIAGKIRNGRLFNGEGYTGSSDPSLHQVHFALPYLNDVAPFTHNSNFTMSCWINIMEPASTYQVGIFGSVFDGCFYYQPGSSTVDIRMGIRGASATPAYTMVNEASYNQWYHLVTTYTAVTSTLLMYVNGSAALVSSGAIPTSGFLFNGWGIGDGYHISGNNGTGKAIIDECAVWSRALAASEVLNLYNAGTGAQYATGTNADTNYAPFVLDHPVYGNLSGVIVPTPLARFRLDGDVTDCTGNGYDGTIGGTPTYVAGKIDRGLQQSDSASDGFSIPTLGNQFGSGMSIAFWMNTGTTDTSRQRVVAGLTGSFLTCYFEGASNPASLVFYLGDGSLYGNSTTVTSYIIRDSAWHHYVIAMLGTNVVFYRDGSLFSNTTDDKSLSANWTTGMNFGRSSSGTESVTGTFDDWRIYSKQLSLEEVQAIYNNGYGTDLQYLYFDGNFVSTNLASSGIL